jgi:hypothetical protein
MVQIKFLNKAANFMVWHLSVIDNRASELMTLISVRSQNNGARGPLQHNNCGVYGTNSERIGIHVQFVKDAFA